MFEKLELGLLPRQTFDVDERFFDEFRSKAFNDSGLGFGHQGAGFPRT
jgi:hypothetical protein